MRLFRELILGIVLLSSSACGFSSSPHGLAPEVSKDRRGYSRAALRHPQVSAKLKMLPPSPPLPKIKLRDAPQVRAMLRRYTQRERSFVADSVKRGERYVPMIHSVLRKHRLPLELTNVAMIESRFIKDAKSHRGAKGMWQFMKRTARMYGLKVGMWKDERKNPRLATVAAAKLFTDLYKDFDDWFLAIAAYNAGPARIRRAIKRCGTRDFFKFDSCSKLRKETLEFVAKFVALSFITRHPDLYGFEEELGERIVRRLLLRARRTT